MATWKDGFKKKKSGKRKGRKVKFKLFSFKIRRRRSRGILGLFGL